MGSGVGAVVGAEGAEVAGGVGGVGCEGVGTGVVAVVPRRNSLGDLKIPARISQAQLGLRRDLGMVREFAISVGRKSFFFSGAFPPPLRVCISSRVCVGWLTAELRDLQTACLALHPEIQAVLDTIPPSPPRATSASPSPTSNSFFHFPRPHARARGRSNTSPTVLFHRSRWQITAALGAVSGKYKVSWECRVVDRTWGRRA